MVKNSGVKGFKAEESLRNYFRSIGYFVVQDIPFVYDDIDVTDIDLWLYIKASTFSIERICVDIKNKKSPQAMERVFWTRGLIEILNVDKGIIVTTDNRKEIRDFGLSNGLEVLQGNFLQRVNAGYSNNEGLSEDEFSYLIRTPCIIDSSITWVKLVKNAKTVLVNSLNFDGCNKYLVLIRKLFDEYLVAGKNSEVPLRLVYLCIAYFLVCLDYSSRSYIQFDPSIRAKHITSGFRFGESGQRKTEEVVQMAFDLILSSKNSNSINQSLQNEVRKQLNDYKAEILGEYFSKPEIIKSLFTSACGFERLAYGKSIVQPNTLSSESKAVIGVFCDFFGFDRKKII